MHVPLKGVSGARRSWQPRNILRLQRLNCFKLSCAPLFQLELCSAVRLCRLLLVQTEGKSRLVLMSMAHEEQ